MTLLLLGFLSLFTSIAQAGPAPTLPEVSMGSLPYKTFSGTVSPSGSVDLFTVPDGQELIVTAVINQVSGSGGFSESNGFSLFADGLRVLGGVFISPSHAHSTFGENAGRLRIPSGQRLTIAYDGGGSDADYFVQAYLVQEGSPYRSAIGTIDASVIASPTTVFTADADQPFIVRTLILYCQGGPANVLIDGEVVLSREVGATTISASPTLFAKGKGALPVPAGSSLAIRGESFTASCDYYLDGEYTHP